MWTNSCANRNQVFSSAVLSGTLSAIYWTIINENSMVQVMFHSLFKNDNIHKIIYIRGVHFKLELRCRWHTIAYSHAHYFVPLTLGEILSCKMDWLFFSIWCALWPKTYYWFTKKYFHEKNKWPLYLLLLCVCLSVCLSVPSIAPWVLIRSW